VIYVEVKDHIFREYDIRGVARNELKSSVVRAIGQAFGTYLQKHSLGKEVCVARDNRPSSKRIARNVTKGLKKSGCSVTSLGMIPTPLLYYGVIKLGKSAGVMVTASHLPKEYNGLKLSLGAINLYGKQIQEIRKIIEQGGFIKGRGRVKRGDVRRRYVNEIVESIHTTRRLHVVVDCGNGVAGRIAPWLYEELGMKVTPLFCEPDSSFPHHHPDPAVKTNLKYLQKTVKKVHADVGLAFDGDGDRLGVVDEQGKIIGADTLLVMFAKHVLRHKPGSKIMYEVKCSMAVPEMIKKFGGVPFLWKSGNSLIKAKMKQAGVRLAGEISGHFFIADRYYGYDDGIYAGARFLELVCEENKKVSEIAAGFPTYCAIDELRIAVGSDRDKWAIVEQAKKKFGKKYRVVTLDGVRIEFKEGWALLRASNTTEELSIRMEGRECRVLKTIAKKFCDELSYVDKLLCETVRREVKRAIRMRIGK
jgi:phosphomannomutase